MTTLVLDAKAQALLLDILGVETPTYQEVAVTPTTSEQVITPEEGYDGISKVTVAAVTSAIDSDITPENIKKDVDILGVVGTLE